MCRLVLLYEMSFKVVVFIYKSASKYFNSLIFTLNNQTELDFEVILFNDDVNDPNSRFSNLKMSYQIIDLTSKFPQDLRFEGLKILKKFKNSFFIFHDCDDLMMINKVELIKKISSNYMLVANDLTTINEFGLDISKHIWRLRFEKNEFEYHQILNYNFVGLGNTSLHSELLNFLPEKPNVKLNAVDWFVFYKILESSKAVGYFTSETTTLYRQHSENTIGIANGNYIDKIIETRNQFYNLIGLDVEKKIYLDDSLPEQKTNNFPFWWELKKK